MNIKDWPHNIQPRGLKGNRSVPAGEVPSRETSDGTNSYRRMDGLILSRRNGPKSGFARSLRRHATS